MSIIGNALTAGGGGLKIKSIQRGVSAVSCISNATAIRALDVLISAVDTAKVVCNFLGFHTSSRAQINSSTFFIPGADVMLKDSTHITITTMNYVSDYQQSTYVSWEVIEFE